MPDPLLRYKIGISLIPKIGPVLAKRLIAYCGGLEGVFHEKKKNLLKIPGIGEKLIGNLNPDIMLDKADREIEYLERSAIRTLFYLDDNYPHRLKQCEDAPVVLYEEGNARFNCPKVIGIVGTRSATEYGRRMCNTLVENLSARGHDIVIVSGLAYGIDICAHKAALKNNFETVAVLGHGLNSLYPSLHKSTAQSIIENGALVSEFLHDETPEPPNFVKRNRIIAGLCDATVVVESGEKGGALITADLANSYNRDVFAFPGRIKDKYSAGCNKLIKTNKAALIEDVTDLEYIMGWQIDSKSAPAQSILFIELSEDEKMVVDALAVKNDLTIDQIAIQCNLPVSKIAYILINLEFNGLIRCLPGKVYKKIG